MRRRELEDARRCANGKIKISAKVGCWRNTFWEDAGIDRFAPAIFGSVQSAVDESDTAQGAGLGIAVLEAASARELGRHGCKQERVVLLGWQLDRLVALVLGDLDVRGHVLIDDWPARSTNATHTAGRLQRIARATKFCTDTTNTHVTTLSGRQQAITQQHRTPLSLARSVATRAPSHSRARSLNNRTPSNGG